VGRVLSRKGFSWLKKEGVIYRFGESYDNKATAGRVVFLQEKLRERIAQLEGVLAVNITQEEDGEIQEIHVLSDESRNPKRLVRDIETVLQVETGESFDHKKISIAQVNEQKKDGSPLDRIQILGVYLRPREPVCTIELKFRGEEYSYKYQGDEMDEPQEIVLKALTKAVEMFIKPPFRIKIRDVQETHMREKIIVIIIQLKWKQGEEILVGASLVDENMPLALSKAFFHALNRKLNTVLVI